MKGMYAMRPSALGEGSVAPAGGFPLVGPITQGSLRSPRALFRHPLRGLGAALQPKSSSRLCSSIPFGDWETSPAGQILVHGGVWLATTLQLAALSRAHHKETTP